MQLTKRAIEKIEEVLAGDGSLTEFGKLVPIIVWIDNRSDTGDNPGPTLGLIEKDRITSEATDLFTDGRLTVYNGLPEDLRKKYQQCVLDFVRNNFEFLDAP